MSRFNMMMRGAPPAVTLAALTLQSSSATAGVSGSTNILGRTTGSTLTLTNNVGGIFSINSSTAVLSWTNNLASGANTPTIRETLAGATNTPRDTSPTVTGSSASKLAPGASYNGAQNSGFGGFAPGDPPRTAGTAKPTLRLLEADWCTVIDDKYFVVTSNAKGGVTSVTATLEGGTPITVTTPTTKTYTDINNVSRSVFGYVFQIDSAALFAKSTTGAATLSFEAIPNDGTMVHRVMNYTIFPRTAEFTQTKTVGASGKDFTSLKAAMTYCRLHGPATADPQRVNIVLTDNGTSYTLDGQDVEFTNVSTWTVITASPGITATIGSGNNAVCYAAFDRLCFRGSGIIFDLAKVGYSLAPAWNLVNGGTNSIWFDGCQITCGAGNPAVNASGSGADYLVNGDQPNSNWITGNDAQSSWNIFYTEVTGYNLPGYGLSFCKLRRNSTVDTVSGSDNEATSCVHGGWTTKAGGYWSTLGSHTPAFSIKYTGGGAVAQYACTAQPGYSRTFQLYVDSSTPTYTLSLSNGVGYTTVADLVNWINAQPGFTAVLAAPSNGLGATYVSRSDLTPIVAIPKTVVTSTPQNLTKIQDVHADVNTWTKLAGVTAFENVDVAFFEGRQAAYTSFISAPDNHAMRDVYIRNCSNQDISASVGVASQPGVWGADMSHVCVQYVSNTNASGISLDGTYGTYCMFDHYAGPLDWTEAPQANMTLSSIAAQQGSGPTNKDANSKNINVASSTLYTNYTAIPPNFAPITSGTPPLRLADGSYAGRYTSAGAEQI